MLRNDIFAAWIASIYLLAYCVLIQFNSTRNVGFILVLGIPVMLGWMIYTILKQGKYEGPESGDEEFGYQDKSKDELGVF